MSIFFGYVGELNCQEISLKIKAESTLEQQILDSINNGSTFKKMDDLLKFLQDTKERLVKKGHFSANFSEAVKKDTLYLVKFKLGPRYDYVNIYGHTDLFKKNGFEPIVHKGKKYTSIPVEMLEKTLESISNFVANENSPFSTVKLTNIRYSEKSLEADLKISKGVKRILNEVKILGYKKFPNSFVKRFLEINTNEVFKLNEINQKMKALNQLSFAKEKRPAELMFKQNSTVLYVNLEKNKSNFYSLKYNFLKLKKNDLLYPLSSALDISLGFGNRKSSNKIRQRRIRLKAERLFELSKRNSLNFKIHLEELKSTEYLFNELMRFGGITSIRGFEENSIYAKIMGVVCSEYRYRFSNDLFVHTVVDSAYFEDINDSSQKIFGFGFGFGLQTNGGLLRLTYANGKTKDDPFDFSKSKLHVSFTSNF